jgi:hypothetical protein
MYSSSLLQSGQLQTATVVGLTLYPLINIQKIKIWQFQLLNLWSNISSPGISPYSDYWAYMIDFHANKLAFSFYQSIRIVVLSPTNAVLEISFPLWTVDRFTKYEVLMKSSFYTCAFTVFFFIHFTWSNL